MKLRIEKAIYGGNMLARIPASTEPELAGKAVFVDGALPGELVDAEVTKQRRSYGSASVTSVLEASPVRIDPRCEYYGQCGGCHYQHAGYDAQLVMKREILAETFTRGHVDMPLEIRTLAAEPWGYRNRIRLHVIPGSRPKLGYRELASHKDLAVSHCPVAAPLLQQGVAALEEAFSKHPELAARFVEVEFFCNAEESALLLSLFTRQPSVPRSLPRSLAEALLGVVPQLRGLTAFSLDAKTRRVSQVASWGDDALAYEINGFTYRVSAGAFFQVNRRLLPQLLQEAVGGRGGDVAWDLYAGVGLFACALQGFREVVAVESSPFSTADLAFNLQTARGRQRGAARSVVLDTLRFLKSPLGGRPDVVIVDPPRAGLGAEVCQRLGALQPKQIVYVSCDPATLTRDLRALQPSGYRPAAVTLVDLFPQTFHMETVATLERA